MASGYFHHPRSRRPDGFAPGGYAFSRPIPIIRSIEFFGDTVDSMSFFDIASQRSTDSVDFVHISPACEVLFGGEKPLYERLLSLQAINGEK